METASLDDFLALNEQLAALIEAHVPLEVGLPHREVPAADELKRISATVIRRVNRGESLVEALGGDEGDIPSAFRGVMDFGLHTGKLSAALDGSSQVAESADDSRFTYETSLIYPLIVCALAYVGLIGFCLYLVPVLQDMYTSLNLAPGRGLRLLLMVRAAMPYWAVILPILAGAAITWWTRIKRRTATGSINRQLRWLPGASRIVFQERCSRFASSLAALLDSKVPLPEALVIAGDMSGDVNLNQGANALAKAEQSRNVPADDSSIAMRFPPFLRWAIWHAEATTGRARALEIAARMYREASKRRAERMRTLVPMVALVLLGGTVTLLYGLTLFVPVVELLRTLATNTGPR
jgi:type II secretory pathway component PulF